MKVNHYAGGGPVQLANELSDDGYQQILCPAFEADNHHFVGAIPEETCDHTAIATKRVGHGAAEEIFNVKFARPKLRQNLSGQTQVVPRQLRGLLTGGHTHETHKRPVGHKPQ